MWIKHLGTVTFRNWDVQLLIWQQSWFLLFAYAYQYFTSCC